MTCSTSCLMNVRKPHGPTVQQEANHEMEDVEETQAIELTGRDEREGMPVANLETTLTMAERANPPEATHQSDSIPGKSQLRTLNFGTQCPTLLSNTEGLPKRAKRFPKKHGTDDE